MRRTSVEPSKLYFLPLKKGHWECEKKDKSITSQTGKGMKREKDEKNLATGLSSTRKSSPQCIRDIEEFLNEARQYAHLVTPDGLIISAPQSWNLGRKELFPFLLLTKN